MLLQPRIKFFSSAKILSIPRRIHGHTEIGNKETLTSISSIICLYISVIRYRIQHLTAKDGIVKRKLYLH